MEVIDNVNRFLGDDLKRSITPNARVAIAASSFSIYAFEALKRELESIESLQFIFTTPTFVPSEVTDKARREVREFHIPLPSREKGFFGTEFELRLKNKLTQRAIAKECADWIRRRAQFRSNRSGAPMQQFVCVKSTEEVVYMPLHGCTAVDLGYQQGNAVSNFISRIDEPSATRSFNELFDQIWKDVDKVADVTDLICDHIASVYQENSPQRIYFLMLYSIFSEFLEDISADVLPNERTGYQNSVIWQKLYHFQKDAATGIINKLETFNGCILADSVGHAAFADDFSFDRWHTLSMDRASLPDLNSLDRDDLLALFMAQQEQLDSLIADRDAEIRRLEAELYSPSTDTLRTG
jgi:hypothetical protein